MSEQKAKSQAYQKGYQNGYKKGKKDAIKTGVWIISCDGYYPYCSECGFEPEPPNIHKDNRTPHCPYCGARMKKEVEDERN